MGVDTYKLVCYIAIKPNENGGLFSGFLMEVKHEHIRSFSTFKLAFNRDFRCYWTSEKVVFRRRKTAPT